MGKIEKIPRLGEEIEGVLLRPELVQLMGMIHTAGCAVAIKLMPAPDDEDNEPVVIMIAVEHVPTSIRLIVNACDELQADMTVPRS
jgi:hypothetical protein